MSDAILKQRISGRGSIQKMPRRAAYPNCVSELRIHNRPLRFCSAPQRGTRTYIHRHSHQLTSNTTHTHGVAERLWGSSEHHTIEAEGQNICTIDLNSHDQILNLYCCQQWVCGRRSYSTRMSASSYSAGKLWVSSAHKSKHSSVYHFFA